MRRVPRISTQRGLGPDADELTDADIIETDGVPSRSSMACPAPSRPSMRYSYVAPRRDTASMLAAPITNPEVTETVSKTLRPSAPDPAEGAAPFSVPPPSGFRRR